MLILSIILTITRITFILSNHPLIIGFLLILTRIIYGLIIYTLRLTPWLTYILIIVFVRGVIIIFIYIASLSSNEPININIPLISKIILITLSYVLLLFILVKQTKINKQILNSINQITKEHTIEIIYKTYNNILIEITTILTIYLLITLIVAINITNNFKKPLREKK